MKKLFVPLMSLCVSFAALTSAVWAGDIKMGESKSAACVGCHGKDGNSAIAINPKLNGQNEKYLIKQLEDFTKAPEQDGRSSPMMAGMAASLSEKDRANIAAYYAVQKTKMVAAPKVSNDDLAIGERIYRAGNEETGVPACIGCHGPQGNGNAGAGWPRLAGQHADYVTSQLKAFRVAAQYPDVSNKGRRNDGDARMMRDVAAKMTDREIDAVSAYVQGLH